jgi:chromosomal replication initiation ATPase DnaA
MAFFAKLPHVVREPANRAEQHVPREWERIPKALRRAIAGACRGGLAWPLYVHGPAGCGKTSAGLWLHDHTPGAYTTGERLIRDCYDSEDRWRWFGSAPLVIVDDVGLRSGDTDRAYVSLWRAAELRTARPVVWIANLTPEQLQRTFDDRLFSRLCCGTVVDLSGAQDQRFLP